MPPHDGPAVFNKGLRKPRLRLPVPYSISTKQSFSLILWRRSEKPISQRPKDRVFAPATAANLVASGEVTSCRHTLRRTLSRCFHAAASSSVMSSVFITPLDKDVRRCCIATVALVASTALPRKFVCWLL